MHWTGFVENQKEWNAKKQNPYVNWWNKTEGFRKKDFIKLSIEEAEAYFLRSSRLRDSHSTATGRQRKAADSITELEAPPKDGIPGFEGSRHPLNARAINRKFGCSGDGQDQGKWIPDEIPAETPDEGTVILGIIDEGISLSHDEFRRMGDSSKTRIISAWQQDAAWAGPNRETFGDLDPAGSLCQTFLPFGREVYQEQIDQLIAANGCNRNFDQDLFDRATGQVDLADPDGPRGLLGRVGHGTHVADLATGGTDTPMMVANLPNRDVIGLSGTFLEFFFYVAVLRMINIADALWERDHGSKKRRAGEIQGYPMVFNLSFSKTAGARDAISGIAQRLTKINADRKCKQLSRIYFSFPAGNDNLLEGIGGFALAAKGGKRTFELECLPEDQSPNFLEIWTNGLPSADKDGPPPLAISVEAPGQKPECPTVGQREQFSDLKAGGVLLGRLYSTVFFDDEPVDSFDRSKALQRQRYILALRPTLENDPEGPTVRPGRFRITLENVGDADLGISLSVQSDQSVLPSGRSGRRAVLIDEATRVRRQVDPDRYRRFQDDDRIRDSYSYGGSEPVNLDIPEDSNSDRYVFRHGSLNALASSLIYTRHRRGGTSGKEPAFIFVSTAHRRSDGRPAAYASTGEVEEQSIVMGLRAIPDVSLPAEDGVTVPGNLAAGARRGSKVALSGTSFAAAQTTRLIIEILQGMRNNNRHDIKILDGLDHYMEDCFEDAVVEEKSGRARLRRAVEPQVERLYRRPLLCNGDPPPC